MSERVMVISGSSAGIGRFLAERYVLRGWKVVGCSRRPVPITLPGYRHVCADVGDEQSVGALFASVRAIEKRVDVLVNSAGVASMNHALLTPGATVSRLLATNALGTFLMSREAAKLMRRSDSKRIVNFTSVARPMRLQGEAAYAASKAAVESLTEVLSKELAGLGIRVNAIGPNPIATDLIKNVPKEKIDALIQQQAIKRLGTFEDVLNVVDFFIQPESEFITGQILYLGGVVG